MTIFPILALTYKIHAKNPSLFVTQYCVSAIIISPKLPQGPLHIYLCEIAVLFLCPLVSLYILEVYLK